MKLLLLSALVVPGLAAVIPHVARSNSTNTTLQWEACPEGYNSNVKKHTLQCATIDVPMNHYNTSSGKTFSIPLVRMLAANSSADVPTILLNPGGPGDMCISCCLRNSGVHMLLNDGVELNEVLDGSFHLLSFDPRGVGNSTPVASCHNSSKQREIFAHEQNHAKACAEVMGEHGLYINTPQTVADINTILDAIGQEKLYYWGFSYGTIIGQTYAQMFPERVGRLVIDGVSDLDEWYNTFYSTEKYVDSDAVYTGFVEECYKAGENCSLNSINAQPFENFTGLKSQIDDLLLDLDEAPMAYYSSPSVNGEITRSDVAHLIFTLLYSPKHYWPHLATILEPLLKRNTTWTGDQGKRVAQHFEQHDNSYTFIKQNDNLKTGSSAPVHDVKKIQNYTLSRPAQSTLISRYLPTEAFERATWTLPTTHTFRPIYAPFFPKFKTANPILVLSTTFDPVCPLSSAKRAHASFEGSGFVEQLSFGHCTRSMDSSCTDKHVKAYFLAGTIPEEGSVCDIDNAYFPGGIQSETEDEDEEVIDEE